MASDFTYLTDADYEMLEDFAEWMNGAVRSSLQRGTHQATFFKRPRTAFVRGDVLMD